MLSCNMQRSIERFAKRMRFFREILPDTFSFLFTVTTCKLTLTGRLFRPEKILHHQPEIFLFFWQRHCFLQTHHVYSKLKRRGNDRFNVKYKCCVCEVMVLYPTESIMNFFDLENHITPLKFYPRMKHDNRIIFYYYLINLVLLENLVSRTEMQPQMSSFNVNIQIHEQTTGL